MWDHSGVFSCHRQARFRGGRRVPRQQCGAPVEGAPGTGSPLGRAAEIRDGRRPDAARTGHGAERAAVGEGVVDRREDRDSQTPSGPSGDGETPGDLRIARWNTHIQSRIGLRGPDLLLYVPSSADRGENPVQLWT